LALSVTTRLTTCGRPLSAGSEAAAGVPTLVGGWLRSLEAGYVAAGPSRAAVRSLRGDYGEQKCQWVVRKGLRDHAWLEECLHVFCNGLEILHGKGRERRVRLLDELEALRSSERRSNDCGCEDSAACFS
jgi:hypothetical protein